MSWLRELIRDTGELVGGKKGRDFADEYDGTLIGAAKSYLGLDAPPPTPEAPPPSEPSPWGYVAAGAAGVAVAVVAVVVTAKK